MWSSVVVRVVVAVFFLLSSEIVLAIQADRSMGTDKIELSMDARALPVERGLSDVQRETAVDASSEGVEVLWNRELGTPMMIRGRDLGQTGSFSGQRTFLSRAGDGADDRAVAVLDNLNRFFGFRNVEEDVSVLRVQRDRLGYEHVRLEQRIDGFRVVGGNLVVHFDADGNAYEVNGRYIADIEVRTVYRLDADDAVAYAQTNLKKSGLRTGTLAGEPELVVFAKGAAPKMAWELTLMTEGDEGRGRWRFWVDARDGTVLMRYNDIQFIDAPTDNGAMAVITGAILEGEGGYTNSVDGWLENGLNYYLHNTSACWQVYNVAEQGYPDAGTYAWRATNDWLDSDTAEMSLARNFDAINAYWQGMYGLSSFDDSNSMCRANVHEGDAYVNAYWDGSDFHFGDGDGSTANEMGVLDIAAHEFGHAVTEFSAGLVYAYESGAINESFSDIAGVCTEFYTQPDGREFYPANVPGHADWLIGEDAWEFEIALRDMRDPSNSGTVGAGHELPSRYKGEFWYYGSDDNGGVHVNCGVQNFFFYLLSEGGSGTNDGLAYDVTGIGWSNAAQVAYRALAVYCTPNTDYRMVRQAWISAADDLDSSWVENVREAWSAVGVSEFEIIPTDEVMFWGQVGGAFAPLSREFVLSNSTASVVTWQMNQSADWADFSVVDGTIAAGDSVSVTVSVNSNAAALARGTYTNLLTFSNTTEFVYQAREVVLRVGESDYFTELYAVSNFDLSYHSLTFVPDDSENGYVTYCDPVTEFASDTSVGTALYLIDDNYAEIDLSGVWDVVFYGEKRDRLFVGSNGYLTFGHGDSSHVDSYAQHFSLPRISGLFDDLAPVAARQDVKYRMLPDRIAVTFDEVSQRGMNNTNSFQFELFSNGIVRITFLQMDAKNGLTGLSQGMGLADDFVASDLSAYLQRPPFEPLEILPFGGWAGTGHTGGPFSPTNRVYTLSNFSSNALNWSTTTDASWLKVSPASGTLALSGDVQEVSVQLNEAVASALAIGVYTNYVSFSNELVGTVRTRQVVLGVTAVPGELAIWDSISPNDDTNMPFGKLIKTTKREETFRLINESMEHDLIIEDIRLNRSSTPVEVERFSGMVVDDNEPLSLGMPPDRTDLVASDVGSEEVFSDVLCYSASLKVGKLYNFSSATPTNETAVSEISSKTYATEFVGGDFTKMYALDDGTKQLLTYATADGTKTVIGPCIPRDGHTWTGLAADPLDWTLYGSSCNIGVSALYRIDLQTGEAVEVGPIGKIRAIIAVAINSKGELYGLDIDSNSLYLIDKETGEPTLIGPVGVNCNYAQGMDFDEGGDILYWLHNGSRTEFRVIDTETGNSTNVARKYQGCMELAIANGGTRLFEMTELEFPHVIPPQGTAVVDVVFAPIHDGTNYAEIVIESNDDDESEVGIAVSGTGVPDYLGVDTDVYSAQGHPGGPFTPASRVYIVTNNGPVSIDWNVQTTQTWLTVSPTSGTLASGATVEVTLSINSGAESFAVGEYTGEMLFSNETTTIAQTCPMSLLVYTSPILTYDPGSFTVTNVLGNWTDLMLCLGNDAAADGALSFRLSSRENSRNVVEQASAAEWTPAVVRDFTQIQSGAAYEEGEMLVCFDEMLDADVRDDVMTACGAVSIEHAFRLLPGVVLVKLADGVSMEQALIDFNHNDHVLYAEPNYIMTANAIPDDELFGELWGMYNTGQTGGTPGADISASDAWDIETGDETIVVGVIDSGVDYTHEDLAENMWMNPGEIPDNQIDDDGNGYVDDVYGINGITMSGDPMDDNSHGTHCAGTIGGIGNNGVGVAGVCWNVRIMALKFLNSSGSGSTAGALICLEYAIEKEAKVLSNSWGGGGYSQTLHDLIELANQNGIMFVAAAGNSSSDNDKAPHYPSSYENENVFAVMSTDANDFRSSFSCYGETSVDIAAPGSSILSCQVGGGYCVKSGTSMATPHVSGACALLLSKNPSLTIAEVKQILMDTVDVPSMPYTCVSQGRMNVGKAVAEVGSQWIEVTPESGTDIQPGSDTNVQVRLTAGDLEPGTYYGDVMIFCNDEYLPQTNLPVTMVVLGDSMDVTPVEPYVIRGDQGGPFAPEMVSFVITNDSESAFDTSVSISGSWLSSPVTNVSIAGHGSTTIDATINQEANTMPVGMCSAYLVFSNQNSGALIRREVQLRVDRNDVEDDLQINPKESLVSSGPVGGPFNPVEKQYRLVNCGTNTFSWTLTHTNNWLSTSMTNGSLTPGDAVYVDITINTNSDLLAEGLHEDALVFSNELSGVSQVKLVSLSVKAPPPVPFNPSPADGAMGVITNVQLTWNNTNEAPAAAACEGVMTVEDAVASMISNHGPLQDDQTSEEILDSAEMRPSFKYTDVNQMVTTGWAADGESSEAGLDVAVLTADRPEYHENLQAVLLDVGVFNSVTMIDVNQITPTLDELRAFDSVLVYRNSSYSAANTLGDRLADYADLGGGVVCSVFEVGTSKEPLGGRWATGEYVLMNRNGNINGQAGLGDILIPDHPIMTGVSTFDGGSRSYRPSTDSVYPGTVLVAKWNDGKPLMSVKEFAGIRRADVTFFPTPGMGDWEGYSWDPDTDGGIMLANALRWVAGDLGADVYDVYFGEENPPTNRVETKTPHATYEPEALQYGKTYYWNIVASNEMGVVTGAVWKFETQRVQVVPESGLESSGHLGGPFSPNSTVYTLSNEATGSVNWVATADVGWLDVEPSSGVLAIGSSVTVTVEVSAVANALDVGDYLGTVAFSNDASDYVVAREVDLTVYTTPDITLDPYSFAVTNVLGGQTVKTLVIGNEAGADQTLSFEINAWSSGRIDEEQTVASVITDETVYDVTQIPDDVEFVEGEMLIRVAAGITGAAKMSLMESLGVQEIKSTSKLVPGLSVVTLKPGQTVRQSIQTINGTPGVLYAEPNYIYHAERLPNDARFDDLWGMRNTGQTGGLPGADISAEEAWEIQTGSRNVVVAVIDTGVDYYHEDLMNNMWRNVDEVPGNGVDDDGNGYIDDVYGINSITGSGDPMDDHNHGTHCAGTIGGAGNNGVGVAGVCWNVQIMALKFLNSSGSGNSANAITCVEYAVDKNVRILSNSWGGGGYSQAMKDAIDAAERAGTIFVAAAGNSAENNDNSPHYPSSYTCSNIVAVMSTTHSDIRSYFSCYGLNSVDIAAPGSSILSCKRGGGYMSMSGTSMATPHVAGACALLLSQNEMLTVEDMKQALMVTVDVPSSSLACVSRGRLNVANALARVGGTWIHIDPETAEGIEEGTFTNVSVTFDAGRMAAGTYQGTVRVQSNDRFIPETLIPCTMVILPDDLVISPEEGVTFEGPEGGPFEPQNNGYLLTNNGTNELAWTVTGKAVWLQTDPVAGSLAPGATTNVYVSVSTNGNDMKLGNYVDTLTFSNSASGKIQTHPVKMNVMNYFYVNDLSTDLDAWCTAPGSDVNNGLDPAHPKASVQSVVATYDVSAGCVIRIDTGTYMPSNHVTLSSMNSGMIALPLIFEASPFGVTYNQRGWKFSGSQYVTLRTAYLTNEPARLRKWMRIDGAADGLTINGSKINVERINVANATRYGCYIDDSYNTIENCVFHSGSSMGIYITASDNVIKNCTVADNATAAVRMINGNRVVLSNNVFRVQTPGMAAISVNAGQTAPTSDYNLFDLGDGVFAATLGDVCRTLYDWQQAHGCDLHSFEAASRFADASAGDYHLKSPAGRYYDGSWITTDAEVSPAIDAGFGTVGDEPAPNASSLYDVDLGRRNLGAYGGTEEASKTPVERVLWLCQPAGGEVYAEDCDTVTVSWKWAGSAWQEGNTVIVEYSTDQGDSWQTVSGAAAVAVGAGSLDWNVTSVSDSATCLVRVRCNQDVSVEDQSRDIFRIGGALTFYVNDYTTSNDVWCTAIGSAENSGVNAAHPKAGIQDLLDTYLLQPGDTVRIDTGTYALDDTIYMSEYCSGSSNAWLSFEASPYGVLLDGSSLSSKEHGWHVDGGSYISIQTVDSDVHPGVYKQWMKLANAGNGYAVEGAHVTLNRLHAQSNFYKGFLIDEQHVTVNNCIAESGISPTGGVGVAVRAANVSVSNCTVWGNGAYGISVGNCGNVSLFNNVIMASGSDNAAVYYANSAYALRSDYNLVYASDLASSFVLGRGGNLTHLGEWQQQFGLDMHSLTEDALLVDPAGGDFHLRSSSGRYSASGWVTDTADSPAIDAGYGDVAEEPSPNGTDYHASRFGLRNLGAYGGTDQASKTPSGRNICMQSLVGGEKFADVSVPVTISWTWQGAGWQSSDTVSFEYSDDSGSTWIVMDGAAGVPVTNGLYVWSITNMPVSAFYRVRMTCDQDATVTDCSRDDFRIGRGLVYYVNDSSTNLDVWCSAAGSPFNTGLTTNDPMLTVNNLLEEYDLEPGDSVYIDTGDYVLQTNVYVSGDDSGSTNLPLTFAASPYGVVFSRTNAARYEACWMIKYVTNVVVCTAESERYPSELRRKARIEGSYYGAYLKQGTGHHFLDLEFSGNSYNGIMIMTDNTLVEHCLVHGNSTGATGNGMYLYSGSSMVSNCTVVNNGGYAIYMGSQSSGNRLRNNVICADGEGKYVMNQSSSSLVNDSDYNLMYAANGAGVARIGKTICMSPGEYHGSSQYDMHSLFADPQFVDTNDFHVKSSAGSFVSGAWVVQDVDSPAIDAGVGTVGDEPMPNSSSLSFSNVYQRNLGVYGGTEEAAKTPTNRQVYLMEPVGGERYTDQTVPGSVRWKCIGSGWTTNDTLHMEYSADSGSTWQDAPGGAAVGVTQADFSWDISGLEAGYGYMFRISCNEDSGASATTDDAMRMGSQLDYYVNDSATTYDLWCTATGNDANSGLDPSLPKATVQSILDEYVLQPGDTVHIDTGYYPLTNEIYVSAPHSGTNGRELVFMGSPYGVTFDRNDTVSTSTVWTINNVRDVILCTATSTQYPGVAQRYMQLKNARIGLKIYSQSYPTHVKRIEVISNAVAGVSHSGSYVDMDHCIVRDILEEDGSCVEGSTITFSMTNCTVISHQGCAVRNLGANRRQKLANNIICASGENAYALYGSADRSRFDSNCDNIHVSDGASAVRSYDVEYDDLASWQADGYASNSISCDPLFANAETGDLHLKSEAGRYEAGVWTNDSVSSPSIDMGMGDAGSEPLPNASFMHGTNTGMRNQGAYGGTAFASKTAGTRQLFLLSPCGYENYVEVSDPVEIRWSWSGTDWVSSDTVKLQYSQDAGGSWNDIAGGSDLGSDDGSYLWNISALPVSSLYRVRIICNQDTSVQDESASNFRIGSSLTYYVNDSSTNYDIWCSAVGDDANSGLTASEPKASVQSIIDVYDLEPGDQVKIDTGNYVLTANVNVDEADGGSLGAPVVFEASPYGVVFDRNDKFNYQACAWYVQGSYVTLRTAESSVHPTVKKQWMTVKNAYAGIRYIGTYGVLQRVMSISNTCQAIQISGGYGHVENCLGIGSSSTAVGAGLKVDAANVTVVNNTFAGNGKYGVYYNTYGSGTLSNNIICADGSGKYGIYQYKSTTIAIDYNLFGVSNGAYVGFTSNYSYPDLLGWRGRGYDAHSLSRDPLFADPANEDYHLKSEGGRYENAVWTQDAVSSPGIDFGVGTALNESAPNGSPMYTSTRGKRNAGAYGGTELASRTATNRMLLLQAPIGNEVLCDQSVSFPVIWSWVGTAWQSNDTVRLEYSTDCGNNWDGISGAESLTVTDGTYDWALAGLPASVNYRVRVVYNDDSLVEDRNQIDFRVGSNLVYYVNDAVTNLDNWCTAPGDDANAGTSEDAPKASIQAILDQYNLEPGDTVRIDTGEYPLTATINVNSQDAGSEDAYVVFEASPYGVQIRRNNTAAYNYGWYVNSGANYVRVCTAESTRYPNEPERWLTISHGYYGMRLSAITHLQRVVLATNNYYGAYVNAAGCKIENCLIRRSYHSSSGAGLYIYCYNGSCAVSNCTITDSRYGVVLDYNSVATMHNNIIQCGNSDGVAVYRSQDVPVHGDANHNVYYTTNGAAAYKIGNTYYNLMDWQHLSGQDSDSYTENPQFLDETGNDYHLQSTEGVLSNGVWVTSAQNSPYIDAGIGGVGQELPPNATPGYAADRGKRNLGMYGGTKQASKTPSVRALLLTQPVGGENYLDQTQPIAVKWRWLGTDWQCDETLNFAYSDNSGVSWEFLDEWSEMSLTNGSFNWGVTNYPKGLNHRVRLECNEVAVPVAESARDFRIGDHFVFYVNDTSTNLDAWCTAAGDDSASGLDEAHPMASVNALVAAYDLEPGDAVRIDTGYYQLMTNIQVSYLDSGCSNNPVVFEASPYGVEIDRNGTARYYYGWRIEPGTEWVTIQTAESDKYPAVPKRMMHVTNAYAAAYLGGEYCTLNRLDMDGNANYGVYAVGAYDTIQHCLIRNSGNGTNGYGIYMSDNGVRVLNCTVDNNSHTEILIQTGSGQVISNCIIRARGTNHYCLRMTSSSTRSSDFNTLYAEDGACIGSYWNAARTNLSDWQSASGMDTFSQTNKPLFADAANGDYHVKSIEGRWNGTGWVKDTAHSPSIDSGCPDNVFSNEPAPNGTRLNAGAYGNTPYASKSLTNATSLIEIISPRGTSVPPVGVHRYYTGTDLAVVMSPNEVFGTTQFACNAWTLSSGDYDVHGAGSGSGHAVDLVLTNDATLTWDWQKQYWLETSVSGNGSTIPPTGWMDADQVINLQAVPDEYHHFLGWTGDVTSSNSIVPVSMTQSRSVQASFAENISVHDIPEWWLAQYTNAVYNTFSAVAEADLDGDGMLSRQEWVADTDPANVSSVLALSAASSMGNGVAQLQWKGGQWARQYLEVCHGSLSSGVWSAVYTNDVLPTATSTVLSVEPEEEPVFYRIRAER